MDSITELHFLHPENLTLDDRDPLTTALFTGTLTAITDDDYFDRCMELADGDNSIYFGPVAGYGSTITDGYFAAHIKTSSATKQAIISWSRSTGVYSELTLFIEAGKVKARLRRDGTNIWVVETNAATYADGAWHRVAVSGGTNGPRIYIDGVVATTTWTAGSSSATDWMSSITGGGVTYAPTRMTFGASRYNGVNNEQFIGRMTNVLIASGVVTSPVLAADYLDSAQAYDVIVLAGQSNTIGIDGPPDPVLDATDPRIRQWGRESPNLDKVILAVDPLQNYAPIANSVGIGMRLAKQWITDKLEVGRRVLLVPVAKSDTGFRLGDWTVSTASNTYLYAARRAQRALATSSQSKMIGVCWQMGENDSKGTADNAAAYTRQFREMIAAWRRVLPGTYPITHGTMPQAWVDEGGNQVDIQAQILRMGSTIPTCIVVDGRDLPSYVPSGYNTIHYSLASAREMGRRHGVALSAYWDNPGDFIARRGIAETPAHTVSALILDPTQVQLQSDAATAAGSDPAAIVTAIKADPDLGTADGGMVAEVNKIPRAAAAVTAGAAQQKHLENSLGATLQTVYEVLDGDVA